MRRMKVLFVCVGNACRSQMAEGFARAYGADVLTAESAGLSPASLIPEVTHKVMREKGIELTDQYPKAVGEVPLHDVDLVVNISGVPLRGLPVTRARDWKVKDPIGEKESVHKAVRDEVERLVMGLVLELRQLKASWPA
ncbi:MAG: arsenate reductase ArsC [Candidatus Solibacter usitatus]|nr:arsenate reductase ArsC [Candidatus Solibacter usitatus]